MSDLEIKEEMRELMDIANDFGAPAKWCAAKGLSVIIALQNELKAYQDAVEVIEDDDIRVGDFVISRSNSHFIRAFTVIRVEGEYVFTDGASGYNAPASDFTVIYRGKPTINRSQLEQPIEACDE